MLEKILLLANLMILVSCGKNNQPSFNPRDKIIDCTADGKAVTDTCNIKLVIDPLTSMTYYDISEDLRQLKGYRARFDSDGNLTPLLKNLSVNFDDLSIPPIQTDGHFRPLIAINGQMPGPTIIAHENQRLIITVYNELKNVEGISIHWHGMHQRNTQKADGVAYITQRPILPNQQSTYDFFAFPAGTHWYHAHSGAQRTDGLYGALIVKDTLPGNLYDLPDQHTLLLMDWQRDASIDLFYTIGNSLRYWKESSPSDDFILYNVTRSSDNTEVGPTPFWSAIINDKGRHYNESGKTNIRPNSLNYFKVSQGSRYRFRLIGAQALYAFRFSIQDHKMTVVATDGNPITPIEDVDYVIINTGERYDVIVHANVSTPGSTNFWIWAETLEDENLNNELFFTPLNKHRAEAILQYDVNNRSIDDDINELRTCTSSSRCKVVNCPFKKYSNTRTINCINADEFESLQEHTIPQSIYFPNKTMFYNFGFDGENSTSGSSLDGVNFRFPANPPLTEYAEFQNSNDMCPYRGCDHTIEHHCSCTQVIDISDQINGSVVELVFTNRVTDKYRTDSGGTSHPIHLHGHYFYVVKIGYPDYNDTDDQFEAANDDIACINSTGQPCPENFITVEGQNNQSVYWRNMTRPQDLDMQNRFARKDTVIVPFGGYTVIRFTVDNPGWWFFHCHIEIHQLEGMAAVVKELPNEIPSNLTPDNNQSTCMPTTCEPCPTGSGASQVPSLMMIIGLLTIINTARILL